MAHKVRDGWVEKGDVFWWLCEDRPEKVEDRNWFDHLWNLRSYPEAYQIKEPVFKRITEGVDEGLCIYEHEDRYKLLEQGKPISKKPKIERKRPEFTFEDGVYLGQDYHPSAGYLLITMEHPKLYTVQQKIGAARKYLKETSWQSCYYSKPLRKKLKLYVKWLQSEMSKLESSK